MAKKVEAICGWEIHSLWVWGQKGDKCSKLSTWLYNFIIANNCKRKLKNQKKQGGKALGYLFPEQALSC